MVSITKASEALGIKEKEISRFNIHQIIQHATLMTTFILLVITGIPMKFNTFPLSGWWAGVCGGLENLRTVHHIAAFVMVAVCFYHLGWLIYTIGIKRHPFPVAMIPSIQDFIKLFQELAYFVGLRKEPPQYGRFNWREKFDYWAIFWGMPVMGLSGFILMFPVTATRFLPGWVVPVAYTAHSHEAMLALLWIMVVHVFFNHFSPGLFPMNKAIFTGKVSEEGIAMSMLWNTKELWIKNRA